MASSPILDVAALREAVSRGESFQYRMFWGHQPQPDGTLADSCFSQWWPCQFSLDEVEYVSAEQYMMAEKARAFGDTEVRARILAATDPAEQKRLGRQVRGYEEATWDRIRFDVVTAGNVAKFDQDPRLGAHLLATGDAVLVEASPLDAVWGIGLAASEPAAFNPAEWLGANLLGFALMRARAALRERR